MSQLSLTEEQAREYIYTGFPELFTKAPGNVLYLNRIDAKAFGFVFIGREAGHIGTVEIEQKPGDKPVPVVRLSHKLTNATSVFGEVRLY